MKISPLGPNHRNFVDASLSAGIWQAADSPRAGAQSTVSSAAPDEGCFGQILSVIRRFIDWIASFFCLSEADKLLQETLKILKEQAFANAKEIEEPVAFLEFLIESSTTTPNENDGVLGNQFSNALELMIHLLKEHPNEFEGNKKADFYLTIGSELLRTGMLNEEMIFQKFASQGIKIDDAMKTELQEVISNFETPPNPLHDAIVSRCTDPEELDPITLVNDLIETYKDSKQEIPKLPEEFPNLLSCIIHVIHVADISKTITRDFYLDVGGCLLKTGKLDKDLILEYLKPTKETEEVLLPIIYEFNKK